MQTERDPRVNAIPDIHGHAKGEHKPYAEERPLPLTARMLFLWFYHACRRGHPRFMMVSDHMNSLTFEDPASVNLVRRALKLAQAGDLYGAAETASVDVAHAQVVSEGLRRGMRYSIGAEVDNDPRSRPDAQNIVEAMRPDGLIRSVHFIPIEHPVHGPNWIWPFDNPEFASLFEHVGAERTWETYVGLLIDAIERLPGHIVGHFYVPAVFGHWPDPALLETYEDRMLAAAEARGMAVEFNTRFLYRDHTDDERQRYLDANRRLLRKAKERGIGIAIGSDAHSPKDQGGAFDTVLAVLDELEINELVFPIGGRLARVALRYVRPPEPEPEPPAAPAPEPGPAAKEAPAGEPASAPAGGRVRKARPAAASAARPKETSSERTTPSRPGGTEPPSVLPSEPMPPPAAPPGRDAPAPTKRLPKAPPAHPAKPRPNPKAAPPKAEPTKAEAPKKTPARPEAKPAIRNTAPKAASKGRPAKKTPPKKAAARRPTPTRTAPKKAPTRKAPAKKVAPVRVVAKRAPAKKTAARKPAVKKSSAKKPAAKRR